jgi:hypothetical protein
MDAWVDWHTRYDDPSSSLSLRMPVVQDQVASALDELPPGPVRVVSMCAGQGRDVLTVARGDLLGVGAARSSGVGEPFRPGVRFSRSPRDDGAPQGG